MGRNEIYPWSTLSQVGDYFIIKKEEHPKTMNYVRSLMAQRNYLMKGKIKYSFGETTYGCIVFVSQLEDKLADFAYEAGPGVYALDRNLGGPRPVTLGERAQGKQLSVREIVNRMTYDTKLNNLPWWYDPKTGDFIMNSKIATRADHEKWFQKEKMPGPDVPYPDYYNLDENMMRRPEPDEPEDEVDEYGIGEETMTLEEILATKEEQ